MSLNRREMLGRSAVTGFALLGSTQMLAGTSAAAAAPPRAAGFGDLLPDPEGILDLPRGFRYRVVSRAGQRLTNNPGVVPGAQDGMAAFAAPRNHVRLVNNHEQEDAADYPAVAGREFTYDPGAQGGTTTIELDAANNIRSEYVSLAGTVRNCNGGMTPWQTWLSCEETEVRAGGSYTMDHGYVFEVDPSNPASNRDPVPLAAMGRFSHESVAVDPASGICYQTEDDTAPNGLFYRFTPHNQPGGLHTLRDGGVLHAMRAEGLDDLSAAREAGERYRVRWVEVPDPAAARTSVRQQFSDSEVTRSRKLEGMWWGDGGAYFVASYARLNDGSAAPHDGQVWFYNPADDTITLTLRMAVTPDKHDLDGPDNITVSPYGGVVVAEDGAGLQHLYGINTDNSTYLIARNRISDSEFTGPTFSPDGHTLFACIQEPGLVLAITGPWRRQPGR